ncbi:MAG: exodeoxyribonuclease VII small subunit [Anaerolineae bacterium]|nr:exodeoxyribonuclease VII small subunit [Anaerolineae bacterium]
MGFEQALARLEHAVARLEEGGLTLDESLALFAEARGAGGVLRGTPGGGGASRAAVDRVWRRGAAVSAGERAS